MVNVKEAKSHNLSIRSVKLVKHWLYIQDLQQYICTQTTLCTGSKNVE